ncbi:MULTISPECIES: molybdopterin oxidoreductase family protein [Streptomyces]|jgi:assimilatory nitrate reductase catalytic subunit|uniref:molybdopterin oxidoreductase family protein n=1 Tax=unclassified Streptomyces TaxID=2593676 RepID=UPI00088DAD3E|nr:MULTISPECIES: molybdopterin oxidoreductase family protein [unclassified Streptomyces]MDX2727948.1 molybdopterin oxidoreductase family protein [Streptomyces sp. PA03-2a]MDX3764412.1 molybdopterin oxidoreductase family protein [Streptomyces sp. AK08-01B]MDX3813905.1 molybdopterin oxidoreductase family protein [Streptomyces sp. AK08-01A]WSQ29707.1 molybdopterin oxidoreductase family protein [Streptomyces sp. NBC_01230]SCY85841.1 assimilatory nitrate reductase catalytic subunit [Streptomyces sp
MARTEIAPTATHCPYCSLQCGMNLRPVTGGPVVEVVERTDFPVNRGALCGKGRTAPAVLSSRVRLTGPLVRNAVGGELEPAGWDEALAAIADGLRRTRAVHGPDAVGVFGGGGLTNEKAYALGKFARVVLSTSQIDYNGRFCMSSAAAAHQRAFGLDRGLPFPLEDIARTGCVILVGSNLAETMPPALRFLTELRENGGRLIVIDPRRTRTAEQADLHLAPRPGTDLALALGMLHLVVAAGRVDEEFVRDRTTGWDEARAGVMAHWPELVERLTGVPVPQLREAVEMFCDAPDAMVLTARGPEQQSKGTDTVGAWINLCLATGRAGRPLSGYGCLTGQGNGQGGREHGQKADQLPGYRKLTDPAARRHVAGVWGVDPDSLPGPGRSAYELLDALGTDVRSLLVMGSNPVVSAPHAAHVEERLRSLDFLAVADVVLSETAAMADVVLPVTQWAEETGTTTSLEGRVLLRQRAVTAPDGVRSDLEVLHGLAALLGHGKGFPTEPEEVFDELRRASAGGPADYAGITYGRIAAENGVFWPCPDEQHAGTPRLFLDRFATDDGRARFVPVTHRPAAEETDREYPVVLTTGRVVAQYQSGAQTRRVDELNAAAPGPFVELHPRLAERIGVAEGDPVAVTSRRGRAVAPARITGAIRQDTVFMPFHWAGEGRANTLTNPALDPVSRMPEFKVCAVRVEAAAG